MDQFPVIKHNTVASKVYLNIKEAILNGDLHPGKHLSEEDISTQMKVSRAPIREALLQLEADGLVEIQTHRGAFIRALSYTDVLEIYTARDLLEGYAASLAARKATPDQVEALRKAIQNVNQAAKDGNLKETITTDFEFHQLVWKTAGHKLIYQILLRLEAQIRMFIAVQAPLFQSLIDSVIDHQDIIKAIEERDEEGAKAAISQHIDKAGSLILAQINQVNANDEYSTAE